MKKKKPQGIQFGIICLVFGLAGAIATVIELYLGKVLTTVMAITPMLLFSGIVFLIIPGNDPPPDIPEKERIKHWWANSSSANKTVWIIAALAGVALGLTLVFRYADLVN